MPEAMSKAEIPTLSVPFVAGIIDSRGHIETNMRHDKPQPRVRVTTRRHGLLNYLAAVTGTKFAVDDRGYERRPCGEHCQAKHQHMVRQSSFWRVDSARATILLWNVRPFIVCQVEDVRAALVAGLNAWPALRGDTGKRMAALGWELPPMEARDVA